MNLSACKMEFIKQVFPRFLNPARPRGSKLSSEALREFRRIFTVEGGEKGVKNVFSGVEVAFCFCLRGVDSVEEFKLFSSFSNMCLSGDN